MSGDDKALVGPGVPAAGAIAGGEGVEPAAVSRGGVTGPPGDVKEAVGDVSVPLGEGGVAA